MIHKCVCERSFTKGKDILMLGNKVSWLSSLQHCILGRNEREGDKDWKCPVVLVNSLGDTVKHLLSCLTAPPNDFLAKLSKLCEDNVTYDNLVHMQLNVQPLLSVQKM